MYKGIIFDLDGVLTDTAAHHFQAWKTLAEQLNVNFTEQDNEALKGVGRLDSLLRILKKGNLDPKNHDLDALMAKKNALYLKEVQALTPSDRYIGVAELLATLRKKGYLLGVASASKNAALVLDKIALTDYFDVVGNATLVKRSKPDPEIFQQVAERLKVDAKFCIGVEDAQAGIDAIISAGMFPVGIGTTEQLPKASIVYAATHELNIEHIESCEGKAP